MERSVTDDIRDIAAFYDAGVEDEDARLEEHQLEYDLIWRYMTRYLPPSGSILEIGAATGRCTWGDARPRDAAQAITFLTFLLR